MLKITRRILAALSLVVLTALFLDVSGHVLPYASWLTKVQLLPAVLGHHWGLVALVAALTFVFGRVYCSVLCPLGVLQDILAHLHRSPHKKKGRYHYTSEQRWLRYPILVLYVVMILAHVGIVVMLLAPYSSYGRMLTSLVRPWYVGDFVWPAVVVAGGTFVVVGVLAWWGGRTYCNTICPVGTTLGLVSRFSLLRIHIDEDKCKACGLCATQCKSGCLDSKTRSIDYSRCVVCGNCIDACSTHAISYDIPALHAGARRRRSSAKVKGNAAAATETGRRAFLTGGLLAIGATLRTKAQKVNAMAAKILDKKAPKRTTPITPPGSLSAAHLDQHCTACQLCVAACPNHVLTPSTSLDLLMKPTMTFEQGFCREDCTRCGEVCPAGGILPFTVEEKRKMQVGHAVWVQENCLAVTEGKRCGDCANACPSRAIHMRALDEEDEFSPMVPKVDDSLCIGCGACESACPATPFAAIYVEGLAEHTTKTARPPIRHGRLGRGRGRRRNHEH